jgi:hypothetical protein
MSLFSISRARVQYLGSCIPLFKFVHSLFESLISAIFENQMKPMPYQDSNFDEKNNPLQEPIFQEKFLMKKFLEFLGNPFLRELLVLSYEGESEKFVHKFNSLTDT